MPRKQKCAQDMEQSNDNYFYSGMRSENEGTRTTFTDWSTEVFGFEKSP